MRPTIGICLALLLALGVAAPLLADAMLDLTIRSEIDEKRNTTYYLVNTGSETVRAKVEAEKFCTGIANNQKPEVREYTLSPGTKVQLGKAWSRSTCRRDYRILKAWYPYRAVDMQR
jgi:hypothetical protein